MTDKKTYKTLRKDDNQTKYVWTRKAVWIKESLGIPTYCFGTLALLKATNGENLLLVMVGLIPFAMGYNLLYEHLFPNLTLDGQWLKVILLISGQILLWVLIWGFILWVH